MYLKETEENKHYNIFHMPYSCNLTFDVLRDIEAIRAMLKNKVLPVVVA